MTAKRFIQVIDGVKDTRTGRVLTHPLEIALKLNEINDLYDYVFNRNEDLEKENEQLKEDIIAIEKRADKVYDENEQLKQLKEAYGDEIVHIKHTIKTMMENERTEIGKNTLKQLWEAIQ